VSNLLEIEKLVSAARAHRSKAIAELMGKGLSYSWTKLKALTSWLLSPVEADYHKIERLPGYNYRRVRQLID
jgi:hypothetical protein